MPAGTPARRAKNPGSIPGRGAQHAHATRRAGHGPRAVARKSRPRHCCTPGTSALRPLLWGTLGWPAPPTRRPAGAISTACPRHRSMRVCTPSPMPTLAQPPVAAAYVNYFGRLTMVRGSIVVSISACHAEDPGSIPGRGGEHCSPQGLARAVQCGAHQLPAHSAHCELPR